MTTCPEGLSCAHTAVLSYKSNLNCKSEETFGNFGAFNSFCSRSLAVDLTLPVRVALTDWSELSFSVVSVVSPPSSSDDDDELEEDDDELEGSSSFFVFFEYHTVPFSSTYFPLSFLSFVVLSF